MGRKKSSGSSTRFLLYAICVGLIAFGLWGTCDDCSSHQEACFENYIDSLSMVIIPEDTPSHLLDYEGFLMSFNPQAHQPNWVAWELIRDEVTGPHPRGNFMEDPGVEGCATLADYKGSGYARGHMAPAGDMKWSEKAMSDCFYLTNMSPQTHDLNNGAWKSLEEKCRKWADRDSSLIIICGPILSDRLTETIGSSKIPVPERYFKVILAPYANPIRGIGFIMNNGVVEGGMQQAAVSIDEVEAATGFDFFSALPDDIEDRVESECNFHLWAKLKKHK